MSRSIEPTGTCFADAISFFEFAEPYEPRDFTIVHGLVYLRDQWMTHAWVEQRSARRHFPGVPDRLLWQCGLADGQPIFYAVSADAFERTLRVGEHVRSSRYSFETALSLLKATGNPGPWRSDLRAHNDAEPKIAPFKIGGPGDAIEVLMVLQIGAA